MIADDLRALLEKAIAEQPEQAPMAFAHELQKWQGAQVHCVISLVQKPLTEDEIRECWSKCGRQAPMAFAHELQKKLGVIKDEF